MIPLITANLKFSNLVKQVEICRAVYAKELFVNSKQTNLIYNTLTPETVSNVVSSNCFILYRSLPELSQFLAAIRDILVGVHLKYLKLN